VNIRSPLARPPPLSPIVGSLEPKAYVVFIHDQLIYCSHDAGI
jgi:hypothetical protein